MSAIVCIHGIGQQLKGEDFLLREWVPAIRDGVRRAGEAPPDPKQISMAFYGHLFRKREGKSFGIPPYDETDIVHEWEKNLLAEWWSEAARVDEELAGPADPTKLRTPRVVQRALNALSHSRFFAGIAMELFIADLKQVYSYFHDDGIRTDAQRAIELVMTDESRVIVAHSLGTVVAYEALCAHPEWPIRTLVTLGSPLGIRNLVFQRLRPPPIESVGAWPRVLVSWVNIADSGDLVALEKKLSSCFGGRIVDHVVHNGATAHDACAYLTAKETGAAIVSGLDD